jgi:hypothetical protein
MQLTSTRESSLNHGLKILIHGPAGSGKTRICSTTGDLENTLILSAEAGLLSLRDHEIDVILIKSLDDMRNAFAYIAKGLAKRDQVTPKAEDGEDQTELVDTAAEAAELAKIKTYNWVCIDSLSEIAEQCLAHEKSVNANGLKAYGDMADTMFRLIRKFRDLQGINVVFTAKQERVTDEGRLIYAPMLPGKQLTQGISYLFDEVFALRATRQDDGKVKRFLQTVNDGVYDAKDRSGVLRDAEPPSLEKLAKKIKETPEKTPA